MTTRARRIIAMGGGGFSMEATPLLDQYVRAAPGVARPRVLFLPTASGDNEPYIGRFLEAFGDEAEPSFLSLFQRSHEDLGALLRAQDAIYVGGGNTLNMLAVWRAHGLDAALREAYQAGVVLAGLSAGAVCWFEAAVTDSYGLPLRALHDGLGLLPGAMVPHYDGDPDRRPTLHRLMAAGTLPDAWAADDGAALVFVDGALAEVVTSRPDARAYRVERGGDGRITERALPVRYLG